MVLDPKIITEISDKLASLLPSGAVAIKQDIEKNMQALLSATLAKLDIITREEFEVHKALLDSALERLDVLERQLAKHQTETHSSS